MIIVELDRQTFQYDVHSLVKAFYPTEDVKMVEETPADGAALCYAGCRKRGYGNTAG